MRNFIFAGILFALLGMTAPTPTYADSANPSLYELLGIKPDTACISRDVAPYMYEYGNDAYAMCGIGGGEENACKESQSKYYKYLGHTKPVGEDENRKKVGYLFCPTTIYEATQCEATEELITCEDTGYSDNDPSPTTRSCGAYGSFTYSEEGNVQMTEFRQQVRFLSAKYYKFTREEKFCKLKDRQIIIGSAPMTSGQKNNVPATPEQISDIATSSNTRSSEVKTAAQENLMGSILMLIVGVAGLGAILLFKIRGRS
ncbi:MAG: hypothetical protein JWN49_610 [Parcubacteria group bacterium]|nr:hypothetical protein [Parcubacteria group bacterium]